MPAIWTFLPTSYYPEARKLLEGDAKYQRLLDLADDYHTNILPHVPAKLQETRAAGVKVAIIAHYGKAPIPLIKTNHKPTDILIDTEYGSCGATVAPIGQTLNLDNVKDPKYLSPDHIIDAGTCALPDQTWFIKYIGHDYEPSEALRMWVINSKEIPTISTNPERFPQYLRLNADNTTEPLDEGPANPPRTILDALLNLLAAMGIKF